MYATVVTRFNTYAVDVDAETKRYMDAVVALPAMVEWTAAANAESHVIASYEAIGR